MKFQLFTLAVFVLFSAGKFLSQSTQWKNLKLDDSLIFHHFCPIFKRKNLNITEINFSHEVLKIVDEVIVIVG